MHRVSTRDKLIIVKYRKMLSRSYHEIDYVTVFYYYSRYYSILFRYVYMLCVLHILPRLVRNALSGIALMTVKFVT